MKNNLNEKLIKKLFSLHPVKHQEIINHFIEEGRHTSESDVVRSALIFYHDKVYPNYIYHLTPAGNEKKEKIESKARLESMSPEDFATQECKALVRDGMAIMYNIVSTDSYFVIPLKEIKEWATSYPGWLAEHKQKARKEPMDETFVAVHLGRKVEFHENKAVI
jgi:Arc/MetJ-type ribon-helix-helix transcriptional regulator